jgi:hypothetical protein
LAGIFVIREEKGESSISYKMDFGKKEGLYILLKGLFCSKDFFSADNKTKSILKE